jgi:formate dehydrogenase major subunit
MLRKKTNGVAFGPRSSAAFTAKTGEAVDRRTFLKRSGLVAGGLAAATAGSAGLMTRTAKAQTADQMPDVTTVKSVCTHCSVGCTVIAEVHKGVWIGQEPGFDSPFNLGAHCAKGAAVREHAHGERRLKHPTKLVDGKWKKISWDEAINEIGDKLLAQQRAGLSVP